MKKVFCYAVAMLALLNSCAVDCYYQVYEVESQDVTVQENILNYENADCRICYDLWSEGGNLSFLIYNKTDRDLYIVMPQSSFILNGVANDYYSESTYSFSVTNLATESSSLQLSKNYLLTNGYQWYPSRLSRQYVASTGRATTETKETKEAALVSIPPKSAKFVVGFNLSDHIYKDCDNYNENFPKNTSAVIHFNKENTPLAFRNRIAYTFNVQVPDVQYIEHGFWLSSLQNYSQKAALSELKVKDCYSQAKIVKKSFNMRSPKRFYNKYLLESSPYNF